MNQNILFSKLPDLYVQECFHKALQFFPELQPHLITVNKGHTGGATMNARPIFNRYFFNKKNRAYLIGVSPIIKVDEHTRIEDVPEKPLVGWFVHELGHIMDYLDRSGWNLIKFGLSYIISGTFRMGAERKADVYAIGQGCSDYILATKKYILEHSNLSNRYKTRIERYYMSLDELGLLIEKEVGKKAQLDDIQFLK